MDRDGSPVESCGRCGLTSVVEATQDENRAVDEDRIELDASTLRRASLPAVVAGWIAHRLDEFVLRFIYR